MSIPVETIAETSINVSYRLLSTLLKSRVSIFAFGAENTGKTSFARRLEGMSSLKDIFGAGRSIGVDPKIIRVNPNPAEQDAFIRLLFIDMGGHKDFDRSRPIQLQQYLPLGILLFLDHCAPVCKGKNGEQIDEGELNSERMKRHHEVFHELIGIIGSQSKVREICNSMVIVVNKYDLWQDKLSTDDFLNEFKQDIQELMSVSGIYQIPSLMPCSVETGEGISDILRTLFRLSGWEIPLPFGIKIRFKAQLLR